MPVAINHIKESIKRIRKVRGGTYPVVGAVDVLEGFTASFQDKMILLSPIKEGVFK